MATRDEILAAAVDYVFRHGMSVIPVSQESKIPAIKWKRYQDSKPTFGEIADWPADVNVGIVTGEVSGIVVVDCESREDAEWFYTTRGKSPTVVQTKRGFHFYFKHPGGTVQNAIRVEGKYDVRGDGGYVLAPPSIHSAGQYAWKQPLNYAALPQFDRAWRPDTQPGSMASSKEIADGVAYIATIKAVAGQGAHNDTYRAACVLRASGMSESEAFVALQQWSRTNVFNKDGVTPFPWSERDLLHKIRDAYR